MVVSSAKIINEFHKPVTGKEVTLKVEPLYGDPYSDTPLKFISGTYYFYDSKLYNGRAKITKVKGVETLKTGIPAIVYGYINTI